MIGKFRAAFATFSLVALISVLAAAPANAATPTGVSTVGGNATLIDIDYGDTLTALLLGESSTASIDPLVGTPVATETLSPLNLHTFLLGDTNLPQVQTTTTGGTDSNSAGPIAVNTAVLGAVIDPATLNSTLDVNGATTSLLAQVADLQALGGVVRLDSASLDLGGLASPTSATANRSLSADGLTVLDLQGLLNLLGLELSDLTLDQLAILLGQLGVLNLIPGNFASPAALVTAVTNANSAVTTASGAVTTASNALTSANTALQTALGGVCSALPPAALALCRVPFDAAISTAQLALAAAQNVLAQVQGVLNGLLNNIGDLLSSTAVLSVDGVQVGAVATAKDTLANSSATVTGLIDNIRVGGISLGAIDVNTTLDQITALAESATTTINTILTTISPALGNLVTVKLLDRATDVSQSGDYVNSVAGITGVIATIAPPDVCAVLAGLPVSDLPIPALPSLPVGSVLAGLESVVPACFQGFLAGEGVQPQAVGDIPVLTDPITFKVASVNSVAEFKVVESTTSTTSTTGTPGDSLPRTGMNETLLLVIGGLMAAAALGLRRVSAPVKARK